MKKNDIPGHCLTGPISRFDLREKRSRLARIHNITLGLWLGTGIGVMLLPMGLAWSAMVISFVVLGLIHVRLITPINNLARVDNQVINLALSPFSMQGWIKAGCPSDVETSRKTGLSEDSLNYLAKMVEPGVHSIDLTQAEYRRILQHEKMAHVPQRS